MLCYRGKRLIYMFMLETKPFKYANEWHHDGNVVHAIEHRNYILGF